MQVLYFASARECTGVSAEELELPAGTTCAGALALLAERHPGLAPLLPHLRMAINQTFGSRDTLIPNGAELALIPPVGGGANPFRIVARALSLEDVLGAVEHDGAGAVVTFTGVVRAESAPRKLERLEYEAYAEMAERELERIGARLRAQWPLVRAAIVHRTGALVPGEIAVVIAVSAPHRAEAFAACQAAIDWLKQDVPIWKREVFADQS